MGRQLWNGWYVGVEVIFFRDQIYSSEKKKQNMLYMCAYKPTKKTTSFEPWREPTTFIGFWAFGVQGKFQGCLF